MNSKKISIYNALENLFQKFMSDSKEKFKKYTQLLEVNAADSKAIEEAVKRIGRTKNKIKLVSLKIIQMEREFEDKNSKIKRENDEVSQNFLKLKEEMFKFRKRESQTLTKLVCSSKNAIEKLKEISELGDGILKTTELCRKLEFEQEKVTPYYEETVNVNNEWEKSFRTGSLDKFMKLKNYLKRYNKVLLDKLAIEKENSELQQHNASLKMKLDKYLEGTHISSDVLARPDNKLLDCNTMTLNKESRNQAQITYVDGALEAKKMYVYKMNR